MAHNLNLNAITGKHSFFSVKEKAWHGLGQIVEQYPTSAEAIRYAGLDYEVVKQPLFCPGDGLTAPIPVPDFFAILRSDTCQPLGVVGKDYHIVQNTDAFSFFDAIVGNTDGMLFETAGALGNGERIFITAKLPSYIRVGREDLIEQYIFLTTSHDGSGSITAAFTPVRIVCNNTLNAALRQMSNVVRIRHTASAKERLANAHKVMGISDAFAREIETVFNRWAKVRISDREVKQLIELALAPNKEVLDQVGKGNADECSANFRNQCEAAYAYAFGAPSQVLETAAGTLFGAYNAVTGYFQNVKSYSGGEEAKLKSLIYGGSAQAKGQKAFNLCQAFAASGMLSLN